VDLLVPGEHRDEMLDALGARLGLLGGLDAKEHGVAVGRVECDEERGGAGVCGERGGATALIAAARCSRARWRGSRRAGRLLREPQAASQRPSRWGALEGG
jgi:hypothetical protein